MCGAWRAVTKAFKGFTEPSNLNAWRWAHGLPVRVCIGAILNKQARKCASRLRDPGTGVFVSSRRQRGKYHGLSFQRSASEQVSASRELEMREVDSGAAEVSAKRMLYSKAIALYKPDAATPRKCVRDVGSSSSFVVRLPAAAHCSRGPMSHTGVPRPLAAANDACRHDQSKTQRSLPDRWHQGN